MTKKRKRTLGQMSERDNAIFRNLYHARVLWEDQLQEMHFLSEHSARNRLFVLAGENFIERGRCKDRGRCWALTPITFKREAEGAGRADEPYRGWPNDSKLRHYLETNDVYVKIAPVLNDIFKDYWDDYPAWEWKDEKRSLLKYEYAGKSRNRHEPDAEVNFGGLMHFVERQTERSKKASADFEQRCKRYKTYMEYLGKTSGEAELMFACDLERDMDHGLEAARKQGIPAVVGTSDDVANYILKRARKVAGVGEEVGNVAALNNL